MGISIIVLKDGSHLQEIECDDVTVHVPLNPAHVHITSADQSNRANTEIARKGKSARVLVVAFIDTCAANGRSLMSFDCRTYRIEDDVVNIYDSQADKIASFPLPAICGCWYEDAIVKESQS